MPIAHGPAAQEKRFCPAGAPPRARKSAYRRTACQRLLAAHTCAVQTPMRIGLPLRGKRAAYWPHIPAFARGSCRPKPFAAAAGLAARPPYCNAALYPGRQRPPKIPGRAACLRTAPLAAAARRKPPPASFGAPQISARRKPPPPKKKETAGGRFEKNTPPPRMQPQVLQTRSVFCAAQIDPRHRRRKPCAFSKSQGLRHIGFLLINKYSSLFIR